MLSVLGILVHGSALIVDSRYGTGYSFLRDDAFRRASIIKTLLLVAKLQLVTSSLTCVCEPHGYDEDDMTTSDVERFFASRGFGVSFSSPRASASAASFATRSTPTRNACRRCVHFRFSA